MKIMQGDPMYPLPTKGNILSNWSTMSTARMLTLIQSRCRMISLAQGFLIVALLEPQPLPSSVATLPSHP